MARKTRTLKDVAVDGALGLLFGAALGAAFGFFIFRNGEGVFDTLDGTLVFAATWGLVSAIGGALGLSGEHWWRHGGDDLGGGGDE